MVHEFVVRIGNSIRSYGGLSVEKATSDPEVRELWNAWKQEYSSCAEWSDIQPRLLEAVASISVVSINALSQRGLDYRANAKHGLHVIAIGGYALSRGLTLEGLTVSYFLRNSQMYDTLMQMGRWFGYRPDYEDLCRVWMPEEAQGWYEHIAEATEELRFEFKAMEAASATPRDFGLKVRSHPDTLIVTARNKMGTGQRVAFQIGLGNSFVETAILSGARRDIEHNRAVALRFVEALRAEGYDPNSLAWQTGGYLLRDVPHEPIVAFVRSFKNSDSSLLTQPEPVSLYIDERTDGELARWDVLFASLRPEIGSVPSPGSVSISSILGFEIHCQRRRIGERSNDSVIRVTNKQRVASRGVECIGLGSELQRRAEKEYIEQNSDLRKRVNQGEVPNYPDHIYRSLRPRPLLIVHLLKLFPTRAIGSNQDREQPAWLPNEPVVAWSISFPKTAKTEKKVEYVVGSVWLEQNMPYLTDDDDSVGDSDE